MYFADFPKIDVYIRCMFLMLLMFSLVFIYTIVQLEEAFFNRYDLVSCKTCEIQQSIYNFFTGKSAEKGGTMKQESTTKDKDGDNSNNSSDQNNDETCT